MSNNFSSTNKENKINQNNCLLCPICKLIPKIFLNELSNEITYFCAISSPDSVKCKNRTYPLNYFNNYSNILSKNEININTKCFIHNKKYNYYCNYCEINLCLDCLNNNLKNNEVNKNAHFEHDIIELKLISPTGSNINKKKRILESLKKNLNKANLIFEEYISKIKQIWNKIYYNQNSLIEFKQKIIDTYEQIENNYNSINNLNQIFNQIKFINKPFDFLNEVILNESTKDIIKKINDIFKIKYYGSSNLDEMNMEEVFVEKRNNTLNSSSSTQKQFSIIKTMISVKMNDNNKRLLKEYLICGLSSGILKIYDITPKFAFKKNIYLNYNKEGFCCNKDINYLTEIYNNVSKNEYYKKKDKLYLLLCSNDLEIIEISNNFENYSFIQKIGEPNCDYDKADFISQGDNQYILAYSHWLSFLNIYKKNKNNELFNLLYKLNNSQEVCVSFIENSSNINYIELLSANYIESEDDFYLFFYKIFNDDKINKNNEETLIDEKNIKKLKIQSFINDQDCLVKINPSIAALITGTYSKDYLSDENLNSSINNNSGIALIDLINKQIITIFESNYYIEKIFIISGGILTYNSKDKIINILKYYDQNDKFAEICLGEEKFYFDSNNFNFSMEDLYIKNKYKKKSTNKDDSFEELILINELEGGIIALAKNQQIKLYK
jgi:hypothetical protein